MKNILLYLSLALLTACGVKSDPLPPDEPVELGRGKPTFKSATQELYNQAPKQKIKNEEQEEPGFEQ